jgi:hypothetical protein
MKLRKLLLTAAMAASVSVHRPALSFDLKNLGFAPGKSDYRLTRYLDFNGPDTLIFGSVSFDATVRLYTLP